MTASFLFTPQLPDVYWRIINESITSKHFADTTICKVMIFLCALHLPLEYFIIGPSLFRAEYMEVYCVKSFPVYFN